MGERPTIPATAPGDAGKGPPHAGEPTPAPKQGDKNWYGDQNADGVDLSLIRARLRLPEIERLRAMEAHARDVERLMEYGRRSRENSARANCSHPEAPQG